MSNHRFASDEVEKFSTVQLLAELKRRYQVLSRPERSCVLLGPSYSGVTTQSAFLQKEWGMCSIRRKDILPNAESDLGKGMSKLSEEIGSFRCRRGFVLSNFPESEQEAQSLDDMLGKKHPSKQNYQVFALGIPSEVGVDEAIRTFSQRAEGHLVHEPSGRTYNDNVPEMSPQIPHKDDVTGEPLVCPSWNLTDLPDRIRNWSITIRPSLQQYYKTKFLEVNSLDPIDAVSINLSKHLLKPASTDGNTE